jgi:muconolactone delta-isomerase
MKYLVHFTYEADVSREEIARLIPAEQARVAQLHQTGILEAVYVSKDVRQGWIILVSEDEQQATESLQSLPLYPFWTTELIPVNAPALGQ